MKKIALVMLLALLTVAICSVALASGDENSASVNLTVEVVVPTIPGGGGGSSAGGGGQGLIYHVDTNFFGVGKRYYSNYDGGIARTAEATSEDGNLTVTIPKNTVMTDEEGHAVTDLVIVLDENPPAPPADGNVIGLTYNFEPSGTNFEPPITMTWTYDPESLPEGITEDSLVLAFYDEIAGEWIELECVVDTVNNTITAQVSHFTEFAVIVRLLAIEEPVTTAPAPIPTSPTVVTPPSAPTSPTVATSDSPAKVTPPPTVTPSKPMPTPTLPATIPEESTPWGIIIGSIISGVIVIVFGVAAIRHNRRLREENETY